MKKGCVCVCYELHVILIGLGKGAKISILLHAHASSWRKCLKPCKRWQYETKIWVITVSVYHNLLY